MAIILLRGPRLLPEYRDPDAGRLEDPLVDLRLFRAPASSAALGMNRTALFVVFGSEPRRSQGRRSWRRSRC